MATAMVMTIKPTSKLVQLLKVKEFQFHPEVINN